MQPPQIEPAMRPDGRFLRLARGGSAALTCTLLAVGAHAAGGGQASVAVVAGVLLGTWTVTSALAGRRLTTSQLVGLLIIGQVAVHVLCAQTAGGGSGWTMVATHVGGTVICAMVLRRGEDALWTLAERLGVRVGVTAPVVAIAPRHVATVPAVAVRSRRLLRLTHVVEGRGPPVGLA